MKKLSDSKSEVRVVGLLPAATYEQGSIALQRGDLVVLFTEGISESMNLADEEWGEAEVVATAKGCRHGRQSRFESC